VTGKPQFSDRPVGAPVVECDPPPDLEFDCLDDEPPQPEFVEEFEEPPTPEFESELDDVPHLDMETDVEPPGGSAGT